MTSAPVTPSASSPFPAGEPWYPRAPGPGEATGWGGRRGEPPAVLAPGDLDRAWHLDFHHPRGIVPLGAALIADVADGAQRAARDLRLGSSGGLAVRFAGPHVYLGSAPPGTWPDEESERARARIRGYPAVFPARWRAARSGLEADLAALQGEDLTGRPPAGILAYLERAMAVHAEAWRVHFAVMYPLLLCHEMLRTELAEAGVDGHTLTAVLQGTGNRVLRADQALYALARRARDDGLAGLFGREDGPLLPRLAVNPAATGWLAAFHRFVRLHGHRAATPSDLTSPSWAEAPEQVLSLLRPLILGAARPSRPAGPDGSAGRRAGEGREEPGRLLAGFTDLDGGAPRGPGGGLAGAGRLLEGPEDPDDGPYRGPGEGPEEPGRLSAGRGDGRLGRRPGGGADEAERRVVESPFPDGGAHRGRGGAPEEPGRLPAGRGDLGGKARGLIEEALRANVVEWNEDHNLVIDLRAHLPVRAAALALAAATGAPAPDETLFLFPGEVRRLALGDATWRELADRTAARREYHRSWQARRAALPRSVGSGAGGPRDPVIVEILCADPRRPTAPGTPATPNPPGVPASPGASGVPASPGASGVPASLRVPMSPSASEVSASPSATGVPASSDASGMPPALNVMPVTSRVSGVPASPGASAVPVRSGVAGVPETWGALPPTPSAPGMHVTLSGLGVSRGTARGTVRVVRSADGLSEVRPGEVLVCEATSPSWTLVFGLLAACVCDTGGMLTHAAAVSREYGIPCVCDVRTATSDLRDGDEVEVDGTGGVVTLLSRAIGPA